VPRSRQRRPRSFRIEDCTPFTLIPDATEYFYEASVDADESQLPNGRRLHTAYVHVRGGGGFMSTWYCPN